MTSSALRPPLRLEVGSIVTLRMRGHSRTEGKEYFAPAVVLNQYNNPTGDIEALVWDPTAGTHYNPAFAIRDLGVRGDGAERETYELQSNIGAVLFSPDTFEQMQQAIAELQGDILNLRQSLFERLESVERLIASIQGPAQAEVPAPKKRS